MSEVEEDLASIIKLKRESLGFSINEVSEKLKISEQNIKFFEHYEINLQDLSTFQRGYLRNYLSLLKLPEERFAIAFYNADKVSSDLFDIEIPFNKQPFLTRTKMKIIIFLVILLSIVIFEFLSKP